MSLNTTTYSVAPYHDDYDEDKGFLKVLFKPGISIQTRELNTLQTQLQDQVNRFGLHFFEDGSPVLDGGVSIDNDVEFIDVIITDEDVKVGTKADGTQITAATVLTRLNQLIKNETNNTRSIYVQEDTTNAQAGDAKELEADVLSLQVLSETDAETKYRLFIRYTRTGDANLFEINQPLRVSSIIADASNTTVVSANGILGTINKVGNCTRLIANEGVYFIDGHFVKNVRQETLIENPQVETPITGNISFQAVQTVVQYTDDSSLLDNATGTPNAQAPGADRYKIALSVVLNTDQSGYLNLPFNTNKVFPAGAAETSTTKFINIQELQNGKQITPVLPSYNTETNRFKTTLAKRTFEESGNYCINPFIIDVRESFNDGGNRGRFTTTSDAEKTTLKSKYSIGIEPSVAYVEGYRVELLNRKEILAPKARDQEIDEETFVTSGTGTYVEGTISNAEGAMPALGATLNVLTNAGGTTKSGDITFDNIEKTNDGKFRLYYTLGSGSTHAEVAAALSIGTKDDAANQFRFSPIGSTFRTVFGASNDGNKIVPLPRNAISAVDGASITVGIRKKIDLTKSGTDTSIPISSGTSEVFYSNDPNDYIVIDQTTNAVLTVSSITLSGTTATLTMSASVANNNVIRVYASVRGSYTVASKTLAANETKTFATPSTGDTVDLGKADIVEIKSIVSNNAADVINLSDFELDNGQREGSYVNGVVTYNGAATMAGTLTITFDHFTHSNESGSQFFTRNSYPATFDYEKIPSFNGRRLSDVFDFRTPVGGGTAPSLDPNTIIQATISYFLPRVDQLIVTTSGKFAINKGVAALNPKIPDAPKNSMPLYNIFLPAYTFDAGRIKYDYIDHRRYTMRDIAKIDKKVKQLEYYTSLSLLEKEASDQKIFGSAGERFKTGMLVDSFTGHNVGDVQDLGYKCAIDGKEGTLRPSFEMNNIGFNIPDDAQTEDLVRLPTVSTTNLIVQDKASVHESLMPFEVVTYEGKLDLSPSSDDWKEVRRRPDVTINFDGNLDAIEFLAEESGVLGTQWNEWETNWSGITDSTSSSRQREEDRIVSSTVFNTEGTQPRTIDTVQRTVIDRVKTTETTTINTVTTTQSRRGVRTDLDISTIKQDLGDRVVDVGFVPFIRSRRIYFKATNMKPNTRLYAFFDDVNVTSYCTKIGVTGMGSSAAHLFRNRRFRKLRQADRIDGFNRTAAFSGTNQIFKTSSSDTTSLTGDTIQDLVTDASGTIEGYFVIPNNSSVRFRTGDRTFKLHDRGDEADSRYATSVAKAIYSAKGLMTSTENTVVSTRKINFSQNRLRDARTLSRTTTDISLSENVEQIETEEVVGTITVPDPRPTVLLSRSVDSVNEGQSFTITLTTTNIAQSATVAYQVSGVQTADFAAGGFAGSNAPANLQGNFTIGADGTATQVFTTAADGDTGDETFTLSLIDFDQRVSVGIGDVTPPRPPRLSWWQRVGVRRQGRGGRGDPIAQTFHLSDANNEDGAYLKEIDLFFQAKHPTLPVKVQMVPAENGVPTMAVLPFGEAELPASSINVSSDASAVTTFTFDAPVYIKPDQEYAFIVRSQSVDNRIWLGKLGDNDLITGKKIDKQPAMGVAFKSANASTWTPMQDRDIKYTLKAHTFMTDTETVRTRAVGPGSATETGTGNFRAVMPVGISGSVPIKATGVRLQAENINLPKTAIDFSLKVNTSSGYRDYKITPNQTVYFDEQVNLGIESDVQLVANLTTRNKFVTPVLDLDRLSLVTINNIINNDSSNENLAKHGNATARYITRLVKLENAADRLTIFLNANRQSSDSQIKVYVRTSATGAFTEVSVPTIPVSVNSKAFKEIEMEFDPSADIQEFQVKIVMLSSNAAKVPRVNDLRVISTIA